MTELVIIGGGRMGEALAAGLVAQKWARANDLVIVEPDARRADELRARIDGITVTDTPVEAAGAVLATKPGVVPDAARALQEIGGVPRVLSIAAGVTLAQLQDALSPQTAVIRAMPNTPAVVGQGASAIAAGPTATDADLDWAQGMLEAVGTVVRVPESAMDAVTGLSGSGPAYIFLIAEALADAGVRAGLPRPTAIALTTQTLLGAATLLAEGTESAAALRAAVTSPGGTTAEGLAVLERAGVRAALGDAVIAAAAKSAALGQTR